MSVFLDGIAAQFYRGIGAEVQFVAPFSRMNFFIGANNAGKSIVLALLSDQLTHVKSSGSIKHLSGPEEHRGQETGQFLLAVGCRPDKLVNHIVNQNQSERFYPKYNANPPRTFISEIENIIKRLLISEQIWAEPRGRQSPEIFPAVETEAAIDWTQEWQAVWHILTQQSGGGSNHWIPETIRALGKSVIHPIPNIYLIPAKRILREKGESFDDLSGKGLIDHLANLQNPKWDRQEDREKFERINKFLQEVIGKPGARLEVPSEREHLLVHMDKKVLPLSSLGTGIHEVILIAAFCTIHDSSIMCIEEPEIHLHPLLQRKLINYLIANTESQYFIATHSAAFIDTPGANIFRVTNDGEQTRIEAVLTRYQQRAILDDLGYQASDILQTNAVIWVEGPSDRIYVNHWIAAADSELKEGIHYTIMFYGGALISHLSASDAALGEFIKLRDLNRNMAIIIDSDRENEAASLKPHAQRLLEEMNAGGGIVWITAGREIENYVDGTKIQAVIRELHRRIFVAEGKTGQYDHVFYFFRQDSENNEKILEYKNADKVGIANKICEAEADLGILDLRDRIAALTAMIRGANGLSEK